MAPNATPVSATSAALVRLLGAGPARVSLDGGVLRFGDAEGTPVGGIDSIETRRSWFWTRLTVREAGGAERAIGGLARNEAERLAQAVRADVARVAGALAPELTQLRDRLNRLHASRRYARKSQSSGLQADIASTVERGGGALARAFLPAQAAGALARIQPVARIEAYEAAREEANARFVAATAPAVARAAQGVLSSPPTAEQAAAIATDEDATLVLAGAGTGKTAVITGKIAHLVRNRGVPPRQILVLAFNRKAAEEIRQRLPDDLAGAHVATFHAFGRRVIADVEVAPTLSKLAEDEAMLTVVIDRILVDLVGDPRQSRVVADFITRHRADYRSQFEFDTPGQYYDYVRRSELRTLSGDLVKSFEELEIANFLTLNSVSFHYEQPYPVETATPWHRQYRPDFYLPDHDIYIEHLALDRQGRPPRGWTGYAEGVGWKRDIHQRYGTRLIETYSWQQREGVLRHGLRQQLEAAGVTFERVPIRTLLLELGRWLISWLAQLIATFLNHVKASGISADTLRERARDSRDRTRTEAFLDLFEQVSSRYDRLLGEEKDFHDLINHAAAHIRNGRWESPFRYVLVDEFQDISAGRMALLQALKGPASPTSSWATTGSRSTDSPEATSRSCASAGVTSVTYGSGRSAAPFASRAASWNPPPRSWCATPRRPSARYARPRACATAASPSSPAMIPPADCGTPFVTSRRARARAARRSLCSSSAATGAAAARSPRHVAGGCASSSARCMPPKAARPTTWSYSTSGTPAAAFLRSTRKIHCSASCCRLRLEAHTGTPRSAASSTSR